MEMEGAISLATATSRKVSSPTWSPDGKKIVFDSRHPFPLYGRDRIYVITAEGKKLEKLTEEYGNRSPVYSPDGTKIAYESYHHGDFNIYLMDANGRNAVKLTRTPHGTDNISPSWLPCTKESETVNRRSED